MFMSMLEIFKMEINKFVNKICKNINSGKNE